MACTLALGVHEECTDNSFIKWVCSCVCVYVCYVSLRRNRCELQRIIPLSGHFLFSSNPERLCDVVLQSQSFLISTIAACHYLCRVFLCVVAPRAPLLFCRTIRACRATGTHRIIALLLQQSAFLPPLRRASARLRRTVSIKLSRSEWWNNIWNHRLKAHTHTHVCCGGGFRLGVIWIQNKWLKGKCGVCDCYKEDAYWIYFEAHLHPPVHHGDFELHWVLNQQRPWFVWRR